MLTDKEILDWVEANPNVQFSNHPVRFTENKEKFPNGIWRRVFGFKDHRNQYKTFREAVSDQVERPGRCFDPNYQEKF
jgi:hypothetical protein